MLSRRDLLAERLNVGPGQYSPEYSFNKSKSPAFRYHLYDQAWGPNMIQEEKQYLDQDNMNTNLT